MNKRGLVFPSISILLLVLMLSACDQDYSRAVYMLVDVSGTYVKEINQASKIIRILVTKLDPGDTFILGRIDSNSFSEKDIIVNVKFDRRSTSAIQQKRQIIKEVDRFARTAKSSRYTDITGAIRQALEYLDRSGAKRKTLIIFSDLKEELRKDQFRNVQLKFDGVRVISINVKKLASDAKDPRKYYQRLEYWRQKVVKGKGDWSIATANEKGKILEMVMR